jgi:hypothetical protein
MLKDMLMATMDGRSLKKMEIKIKRKKKKKG